MSTLKYDDLLDKVRQYREKIQFSVAGQNPKSVVKAINLQEELKTEIDQLIADSVKLGGELDEEDAADYKESLEFLKNASQKQLKCLETLKSISTLENQCWNLSHTIDLRSVDLATKTKEAAPSNAGSKLPGFIGQMSQNCIFGVKDNWDAISNLVRCLQVHLKSASEYHQFYHEVEESEKWMNSELDETISNFEKLNIDQPDDNTISYFLTELEAIHLVLYQWKTKLDRLLKVASTLVPVDLRTQKLEKPIPAISLCSYYSTEVNLRENEDILLLEGCTDEHWKVRNGRGDEGLVPSLVVLIPGPDQKAAEALDKLRFILLTYWTCVVKNYGKRLITLLLRVYKSQYTTDELSVFHSLESWERDHMLEMLKHVEDVLRKYWATYDGFLTLEERLGVLKLILEGDTDAGHAGTGENKKMATLINSTPSFNKMATIYQDLSKYWEMYRTTVDVYKYPELMLALDKWQQLQYLPTSQVSQFWKTTLQLETSGSESGDASDLSIDGEKVEDTVGLEVVRSTASGRGDSTDGDLEKLLLQFTEAGQYEQIVEAVEVQATEAFGSGQEQVSKIGLDAGMQIKKPTKIKTLASAQIGTSEEGFEEVKAAESYKEERTSSEDQSKTDFGSMLTSEKVDAEHISSAHLEERQTFTIKSVVNPANQKDISLDEAIYRGVIIPAEGVYRNTVTGENIPIQVAMMQGLIKVAYSTRRVEKEKKSTVGIIKIKSLKEVTRPFTVVSARDTVSGADLDLKEASEKGILDIDRNFYMDLSTGKKFNIHDAAEKKLVKIEYTGEVPPPEEVVKRYAVRAVVDRRNKKTVTFDEAVKMGLIDRETGSYKDNVTNEKMYVGDALVKGFLKARQITEAEAGDLNIDPTNQIVVDRTQLIKKRIIKPLAALGALRKLGGVRK